MAKLFSRERLGIPQVLAALMLLVFVIECVWLVAHIPPGAVSNQDFFRVQQGIEQWRGKTIAGTNAHLKHLRTIPGALGQYDRRHSPVWYLIESAPLALFHIDLISSAGTWLSRVPYILIGALLGASLWYVSRRLYGNAGGYIALSLYCFSPAVIRSSALWLAEPNVAGAWGSFGAVFTAIAVSHTLYAPREVVLWNWRRIVLLGVSITLAVGSQFSLAIIIPVLLVFMLYVAAERWAAAIAILAFACAVASALLFASYFFQASIFSTSLTHADWLDVTASAIAMPGAWRQIASEIKASGPVLALLAPAALIAYFVWRRTRYFGNTAPLLVALLFVTLRAASPHAGDSIYGLIAIVFTFLFVAGIAADFLETRFHELTAAVLAGLLAANALWNLVGLAKIAR